MTKFRSNISQTLFFLILLFPQFPFHYKISIVRKVHEEKNLNEETSQKSSTSKTSCAQEEWMARKRQFVDWIPGAFSTWPRHGAIQLTQLTRDSRYVVLTRNVPRMSIFVNGQTAIGVQWLRARVSHTCAAIITHSRAIWWKRSSLTNDGHDPANRYPLVPV